MNGTRLRYVIGASGIGAFAMMAVLTASGQGAQQPPDTTKVLIVGENPSITHRANPGGRQGGTPNPTISNANYWRVSWSPVGTGHACFITVNEPTPNATKIVITDNPALAEYISKEVMVRLVKDFATPAYTVVPGVITQTTEGAKTRTDLCRGGNYTVELKYSGLGEPRWEAPGFGVNMTLVMLPVSSAEITINGKRAPGAHSSGFLALNETWRLDK